jgi:hypothetical protein
MTLGQFAVVADDPAGSLQVENPLQLALEFLDAYELRGLRHITTLVAQRD